MPASLGSGIQNSQEISRIQQQLPAVRKVSTMKPGFPNLSTYFLFAPHHVHSLMFLLGENNSKSNLDKEKKNEIEIKLDCEDAQTTASSALHSPPQSCCMWKATNQCVSPHPPQLLTQPGRLKGGWFTFPSSSYMLGHM